MVTGATGFVGRAVVAELVRRGHDVVALARDVNAARRLGIDGASVRLHSGDLADRASLASAASGCDAVVHAAALVDPALVADEAEVYRVNRDFAVELGRVARDAGIRRFVFVSSIAAMGFWSGAATSTSTCRPESAYGRAKLDAERGLLALATTGFDVVVLRLPTVYGPGERYNFLSWARAVDSGVFRLIGDGGNVMPLCTTANAARAAAHAAEGGLAGGVHLVADAEPYSMTRIHRALLGALGRREPLFRLPHSVAWIAGLANEIASSQVRGVPQILSRARVRTLTADQPFDVHPLLDAGVELDAPLEEWVEATVRDYRNRGALAKNRAGTRADLRGRT
jgi:nucleoside-diphosphate-sugar epimerase